MQRLGKSGTCFWENLIREILVCEKLVASFYLPTQVSTFGGSHSLPDVQFENEYGKDPNENWYPFGHLYCVASILNHIQPPKG